VILIISGIGYTLVGIKNKWLHIYLSAAYLASLAVTVLIMYVMNPPVSNAIQGAYVVAVAMTGLILGGAAIVFTEMTEGLGCLLGGFCFSMWLLVLKPGGLLTATSSKSIFIAAFTLAVFATSFSHYTRPYGLIVSISFAGATVVVLGIDCFSRAGLKEFWAYLWDLNSNLFPLGATSYPLTRGIRVEIAAIVIIFLAGIVSQSKLWKVIKQRREQRTAERLQDERNMEQEEENVGKRIEHANAEERNQWEAVYGDKDAVRPKPSRRDSGVADSDSQKKGPISTVTTLRQSGEDEIEMSEISSPTLTGGAGLVMTNNGQDGGPVTVRVARDLEPPPELDENGNPLERDPNRDSHLSARSQQKQEQEQEMIWVVGADGEARLERRPSKRNSKRASHPVVGQAPDIVPFPFKVPEGAVEDDRSSVATFADEEQAGQKRRSKHLSAGSMLMRKLSQRSRRLSKGYSTGHGPSTEDLVVPHAIADDQSSIAATMDGLSDDEDMRSIRSSVHQAPDTTEAARVPEEPLAPESDANNQLDEVMPSVRTVKLDVPESDKSRRESAMTVATAILDTEPIKDQTTENTTETSEEIIENSVVQQSLTSSTDPKQKTESAPDADKEKTAPSIVSAVESKPASITKDRLPAQLSRVVMSYRTNEWAKHLSSADAPDVDELKLAEYPVETQTVLEVAAPVNMEELSQTAQNASPPPASRTVSQMSNYVPPPLTRSSSAQSKTHPSRPETSNGVYPQDTALLRSMSQQSLPSQISQQNMIPRGFRSSSSPHIPHPIVESPIEEEFPSTSPNYPSTNKFSPHPNIPFGTAPTLIGKRDSMLRSKTSYFSNPSTLPSTPEFPMQFPTQQQQYSSPPSHAGSDAGSLYNYPNTNAIVHDDDNMSLSARRDLIRQSSLQQLSSPVAPLQQTPIPFDSHQPRRQSSTPSPAVREQQLASWRASVQHDLQSAVVPKNTIERQRSALWQERQQDEQRRAIEERRRGERDSAFDERMRRGDMLDAHREALRKMQATANRHAS
jgi:hypothetical protein